MSTPASEHPIKPHRAKGRPRSFDRAAALEKALRVFWTKGFAPATVAELCAAMGINPPSLYAAFGNKAQLFMEAVGHYERVFWDATWDKMGDVPDVRAAIGGLLHCRGGHPHDARCALRVRGRAGRDQCARRGAGGRRRATQAA